MNTDQEERSITVDQTIYSVAAIRALLADRMQLQERLITLYAAIYDWYDAVERGGFPGRLLGPHGRALAELAGITIEDQPNGNEMQAESITPGDCNDRPGEASAG